MGDAQDSDHALGHALATKHIGGRLEQGTNATVTLYETVSQRLGVAARDREHQEILDQFMVEQRMIIAIEERLSKARTMCN